MVTFDDGTSVSGRVNSCMSFCNFREKYILVKAELGSGKSFQAQQLGLGYSRIVWLTSSRILASHTSSRTGYVNYQNVPHSTPLSLIDRIVILAPSIYRLMYQFKPYELLIIDEAESFFEDVFSGLCSGPIFEQMMIVIEKLFKTSQKVVLMDGFLSDSSVSVCCAFANDITEIRLVIGQFRTNRGVL